MGISRKWTRREQVQAEGTANAVDPDDCKGNTPFLYSQGNSIAVDCPEFGPVGLGPMLRVA